MYEEMLNLVRGGYSNVDDDEEEEETKTVSPSGLNKKDDLSDNEGFNDERDENFEDAV